MTRERGLSPSRANQEGRRRPGGQREDVRAQAPVTAGHAGDTSIHASTTSISSTTHTFPPDGRLPPFAASLSVVSTYSFDVSAALGRSPSFAAATATVSYKVENPGTVCRLFKIKFKSGSTYDTKIKFFVVRHRGLKFNLELCTEPSYLLHLYYRYGRGKNILDKKISMKN